MRAALNETLKKILQDDIPVLPKHHHEGACDCIPTVAYIRVSKVGKRTRLVSPKIQLDEISASARRNGLRVVKLVFDINKSGQDFDREAFAEVVADVEGGLYRHVSVWKWSRFGRTLLGSLSMIARLDESDGVVESATEPFDEETAIGRFGRDNMLVISALQSNVIGETWRSVHATRRENKLPHSGRKKFGYDYIVEDERDRRYEINESESPVLQWAYEQYVAGTSARKIAAEFNAQGFRTERGNRWTGGPLTDMMDAGFAAGLLRSRTEAKLKAMKRRPANIRKSYDEWRPGKQPTIISIELWDKYVAIRKAGEVLPARSTRAVHELSALLFCWVCAKRLTTKYAGQSRQHRWYCPNRDLAHPEQVVSVSNDDAIAVVRRFLRDKSEPDWIEQESRRRYELSKGTQTEADRVAADLRGFEGQADRAMELYLTTESDALKTRALVKLEDLNARVAELRKRKAELDAAGSAPNWEAFGFLEEAWEGFQPSARNAALREVVGMVVISPAPAPRVRRGVADRVRVVPLWEMGDWSDWASARAHRSA